MVVPADIPVTVPPVLIVATEVDVLLHVPPLVPSVNVVFALVHTLEAPDILAGVVITVIT